jgi:nitrogen-specific signal transduction histidine kinase
MSPARTNMAQNLAHEPAEVLVQCTTAMAQLDSRLQFTWLNPALAELLGAGMLRWQGASLEVIDPGTSGIVDAARRALTAQQVVVLRQVGIRSNPDEQFVGDIAFSPLGDARLLLELHPFNASQERGSPALSESLRGFAHEV